MGWPKKIGDQVEATELQLEEDENKFQKNLQNDQSNFDDRLDTIEVQRQCAMFIMHVCHDYCVCLEAKSLVFCN